MLWGGQFGVAVEYFLCFRRSYACASVALLSDAGALHLLLVSHPQSNNCMCVHQTVAIRHACGH